MFNLSDITLEEKFSWLKSDVGSYHALESVVSKFDDPCKAVMELVKTVIYDEHDGDSYDSMPKVEDGDISELVAWFVDGCDVWEALDVWKGLGYDVAGAVDAALMESGAELEATEVYNH